MGFPLHSTVALILTILAAVGFQPDPELVERLRRRDPAAMTEIYDRFGRLVFSLIVRMVRDESVAEDLVQETFLRIWTRSQIFDGTRGALGAWIVTVARNRAIDYIRSSAGRASEQSVDLERFESPAAFANAESELVQAERGRRTRESLMKLPANQREALELAYFEGLTQTEIAERMKQPLGTVKTWMRTGMRVLREELGRAIA